MSMDPAEKRAAWQRLKELAGNGRLVPEKRKGFTGKERAAVYAAFDGRCVDCDRNVGLRFEIDHRIPLFRGGKHVFANWQLMCATCHENKTGIEATGNGKIRRIEARELEGPKPAKLKSRANAWPPAGTQRLQSRPFPTRKPA